MPPPDGIICKWCNGKFLKPSFPFHEKKCQDIFYRSNSQCEICNAMVHNNDFVTHQIGCKERFKKLHEMQAKAQAQIDKRNKALGIVAKPAVNLKPPASGKCQECDQGALAFRCDECEQYLCTECDTSVHSKGARIRHARKQCDAAGKVKAGTMAVSAAASNISAIMESGLKGIGGSEDFIQKIETLQTDEVPDDRMPCHFCGRKFAQLRIAMHEAICAQPKKTRKVHDGAAKRIEGTDFAEFKDHRSETPPQVRKERLEGSRWRANAATLQAAMNSGNEWAAEKRAEIRKELEAQLDAHFAANGGQPMKGKKIANISEQVSVTQLASATGGSFAGSNLAEQLRSGRPPPKGIGAGGAAPGAAGFTMEYNADQAMRVEVWRALLRERGIVTDEDKKEQRERFEAARKAEAEEKQRLLKEKREQNKTDAVARSHARMDAQYEGLKNPGPPPPKKTPVAAHTKAAYAPPAPSAPAAPSGPSGTASIGGGGLSAFSRTSTSSNSAAPRPAPSAASNMSSTSRPSSTKAAPSAAGLLAPKAPVARPGPAPAVARPTPVAPAPSAPSAPSAPAAYAPPAPLASRSTVISTAVASAGSVAAPVASLRPLPKAAPAPMPAPVAASAPAGPLKLSNEMNDYRAREQLRRTDPKAFAAKYNPEPAPAAQSSARMESRPTISSVRGPPPPAHSSALPSGKEPQVVAKPQVSTSAPPVVAPSGPHKVGGSTQQSYKLSNDKDALRAQRAAFFESKLGKGPAADN